MAGQSQIKHGWRTARKSLVIARCDANGPEQRVGVAVSPIAPDWAGLNTIEMLGLLDEIGSRDKVKSQILNALARRLGSPIGETNLLVG